MNGPDRYFSDHYGYATILDDNKNKPFVKLLLEDGVILTTSRSVFQTDWEYMEKSE